MSEKIKDGPFEKFHENGQISQRGFYVNGKKDGIFQFYDIYGVLEKQETYVDGIKNGNFYIKKNNKIIKEGTYEDNKLYGTWTKYVYDKKGFISSIEQYLDGKKHGEWKIHCNKEGSNPYTEIINFKNGKKHGKNEIIYSDGYLRYFTHYKDGVKHGLYEHFTRGEKDIEGTYKNGKKHGVWIESGKKETFKNGKKDGESTYIVNTGLSRLNTFIFDELGVKSFIPEFRIGFTSRISNPFLYRVTLNYKNDKLDGLCVVRRDEDEVGKNFLEKNYKNGLVHGTFKVYNTTIHKLSQLENYKNGLLDGKSFYYNTEWNTREMTDEKRIFKEVDYKNGKIHGTFKVYHFEYLFILETYEINLIYEGNYKNGKLHGVVKKYNESGSIKRGETYNDGKLIDSKEY